MGKDTLLEKEKLEEENIKTKSKTETAEIINQEETNINTENNTEENAGTLPKNHMSTMQIFLIILTIFIAILLISFVGFTVVSSKNDNIISGVYINRFNVSKLNKEQALKTINNRIAENIPEEIKLKYNDYETTISTSDLNISFDVTSAVNNAYKHGRSGNLLENDLTILQTLFSNIEIGLNVTLDEEALKTS